MNHLYEATSLQDGLGIYVPVAKSPAPLEVWDEEETAFDSPGRQSALTSSRYKVFGGKAELVMVSSKSYKLTESVIRSKC